MFSRPSSVMPNAGNDGRIIFKIKEGIKNHYELFTDIIQNSCVGYDILDSFVCMRYAWWRQGIE